MCSTSPTVRGMQIRTTSRSILPHQNGHHQEYKCQQRLTLLCERGTLLHCPRDCDTMWPLWNSVWRFLKKLKMEPPHEPSLPFQGMYPKDVTLLQRAFYISMLLATLFTIAREWNGPRRPLKDECIRKTCRLQISIWLNSYQRSVFFFFIK